MICGPNTREKTGAELSEWQRRPPRNDSRVYRQILRLYYTGEALRGLRYGATVDEVLAAVIDRYGEQTSRRTTYRDLEFLELLGLATRIEAAPHRGFCRCEPARWKWNDTNPMLAGKLPSD